MPIPAVVESSEQIPEGLSDHYTEKDDGMFHLTVEPFEANGTKVDLVDVKALEGALEAKKGRVRELSGKAKAYEKLGDPDELAAALEFYQKHKDSDPEKVEERFRTLSEQKLQQVKDEHSGELSKRDKMIRELTVGRDVADAIAKAGGVKSEYAEVLEDFIGKRVDQRVIDGRPVSVVLDTDGEPLTVKGSLQPLTVEQWVKDNVKPKFADMFLGQNAGGGGSHRTNEGGGSGGTWTREQWDNASPEAQSKFSQEGGQVADG